MLLLKNSKCHHGWIGHAVHGVPHRDGTLRVILVEGIKADGRALTVETPTIRYPRGHLEGGGEGGMRVK